MWEINKNYREDLPTDLVITYKNAKILIITAYKSIQINLKDDLNIAKYTSISNYLRSSRIFDYCKSKFFLEPYNKLKVFLAKKQVGPVENIT